MAPFADMPTWLGWLFFVGGGLFGLFLVGVLVAVVAVVIRSRTRTR